MSSIADQYTLWEDRVVIKKKGKRVIVERDLSMDKIYHAYYWYVCQIASQCGHC